MPKKETKEVELTMAEARQQNDMGRRIARIGKDTMKKIDVTDGDYYKKINREYHKSVDLHAPVKEIIHKTYNNGVLEVRVSKRRD